MGKKDRQNKAAAKKAAVGGGSKAKKLKKEAKVKVAAAGGLDADPQASRSSFVSYRDNLRKLMNLTETSPNMLVQNSKFGLDSLGYDSDSDSGDSDDEPVRHPRSADGLSKVSDLNLLMSEGHPRMSRGEKKARRLLQKLDLKPIENVVRVTMRKSKNLILFIDNPEVFKVPHTDTIIFFGEVQVDDRSSVATARAAERYMKPKANPGAAAGARAAAGAGAKARARAGAGAGGNAGAGGIARTGTGKVPDGGGAGAAAANPGVLPTVPECDEDVLDEAAANKLDFKDIELVQLQTSCSRNKAINALTQNDGDVVNAIMNLTIA